MTPDEAEKHNLIHGWGDFAKCLTTIQGILGSDKETRQDRLDEIGSEVQEMLDWHAREPWRVQSIADAPVVALSQEEADLLRGGSLIDAIKCLRRRAPLGLAQAKSYIEAWDRRTILKEEDLSKACKSCAGSGVERFS